MTISAIDESQRKAARVAGFSYLFALATAVFAEFYVRGQLIVQANAAETARNIMAHERLWRLGIASYLLCLLTDVALIAALYVILKQVNQNLALFAAFMRAIETAIVPIDLFPVSAYGAGIHLSFVFLGVGSTVFGYLWFKSKYIPRGLAALGVVASFLLAAGSFTTIIFPNPAKIVLLAYMMPLGVFELAMGFWLLLVGLRPSGLAAPEKASA
jgi:hypothetical protein